MKIQYYFTSLVLATVIILIVAADWTQSKKSATEKREAFYESLDSQASNFEQSIKARIENLRYQLTQAASRHSDSTSSLSSESVFSAIAWLQKNPEGSATKYKAIWAEANTQTFDPTWLKGLNFSQVKDGETLFVRRVDRFGNAFFALVMTAVAQSNQTASQLPENTNTSTDERVYLFAAVSPSTISSWVDEWVGSTRAAIVFDEHGNVVSHSQRQYSGTNLNTDKLVNSSVRSGKAKITTEYSDLENDQRIGESLRIGQTNLRAAISVPKNVMLKSLEGESGNQRGLMITLGLFLVALTHFVAGRFANKIPKTANVLLSPTTTRLAYTTEQAEPVVVMPEPELTFEQVEQRTKLNLEEILARSAEIRQRLQMDFVESIEAEQKVLFEEVAELPLVEEPAPKLKVRRPKVSL